MGSVVALSPLTAEEGQEVGAVVWRMDLGGTRVGADWSGGHRRIPVRRDRGSD